MYIKIRQASIKDLDSVAKVEMDCFPEAEAAMKVSLEKTAKLHLRSKAKSC